MQAPSEFKASMILFLSAAAWGCYWVPLRYFETLSISGSWAVAAMNAPAAFVLFFYMIWKFKELKPTWKQALVTGVFIGLGLSLYATGLVLSTVVRATLLFYLTPIWGTLIGIFFLREPTSWVRWLAIATALVGLVFLMSGGNDARPLNLGDLFGLLSGICWAIGASLIVRYPEVPVASMAFFQFLTATAVSLMLGAALGYGGAPNFEQLLHMIPVGSAASLLVILPTVFLVFWAQKFLFPGRAGLLMMSEVLVAVATAALFLPHERMGLIEWIGAAIIIGACVLEIAGTPQSKTEFQTQANR